MRNLLNVITEDIFDYKIKTQNHIFILNSSRVYLESSESKITKRLC